MGVNTGRPETSQHSGVGGALLDDPFPDDGTHWFPDDLTPGDLPPDGLPDDPGPAAGPDWPPSMVPVVLWPIEILQQALAGAPGAQLARIVAEAMDRATDMDPDLLAELPDDALGDLATACWRLQSWAAGLQARVVAERAARETHALAHNSLIGQVTSELVVTEPEATAVVVRAEAGAVHPTVIAALVAGRIDVRKAHTLLRSASQLTASERAEAIDRYLPQAPRRTWKWLQTRMLAFAKARHGAAESATAEAQRRCVQLDRAENDMGWLSAYLPAADAAAVWGVVDDMARQLRQVSGEDRTLGQLRADSLTGLVTGRLLPGDRYAETCTTTGTDATGADGTNSTGTATVCTCGGRAPVVQEVVQAVRITPSRPVVRVTVPAGVLLGLDDAPGDLAGFGPIPAQVARVIAQDATWRRLVTDPVTGILTDYSTTTYQPGKVLRAAVQARDETCMFLTCDSPAVWDDLDHIVPFDHDVDRARPPGAPGQTHAGWGVVRDPESGVTIWTSPVGRTHARPPTVLDTHVELDQIDPDTSHDLTVSALTGRRLPRPYAATEPGAVPTEPTTGSSGPSVSDRPPF